MSEISRTKVTDVSLNNPLWLSIKAKYQSTVWTSAAAVVALSAWYCEYYKARLLCGWPAGRCSQRRRFSCCSWRGLTQKRGNVCRDQQNTCVDLTRENVHHRLSSVLNGGTFSVNLQNVGRSASPPHAVLAPVQRFAPERSKHKSSFCWRFFCHAKSTFDTLPSAGLKANWKCIWKFQSGKLPSKFHIVWDKMCVTI